MEKRRRIGEILTAITPVDEATLANALNMQAESGDRLGETLVKLRYLSENDLAKALAEQLGLPLVGAGDYADGPAIDGPLPVHYLRTAKVIPLRRDGDAIVVAMADPLDDFAVKALEAALGARISIGVGTASDIEAACARLALLTEDGGAPVSDAGVDADDVQHLRDLASGAPAITLLNDLIYKAAEMRASDIHIEPFERMLQVRYRIDGVLRAMESPPVTMGSAIVSRAKVLADLNIAERRLPQDGRFQSRINGRGIDLRISTIPTVHGESVVLRLLDKGEAPLDLASLGCTAFVLRAWEILLEMPHGVVLVTGPTGSGKTTTLYAALQRLNTPDAKLVTVEDPVEYQLPGINQVQVRAQPKLDFARALRSILRHDPDVIMVGEMRDMETAHIAVQAALTGHKVLSTLHTNDAASSITRLLDMGVPDYLLTSTINGIVAQRLVRTLCEFCKTPLEPDDDLLRSLEGIAKDTPDLPGPHEAVGCERCDNIGYRGRTTVSEVLIVNAAIRQGMLSHLDSDSLRTIAIDSGMQTMHEDGLFKVAQGITTMSELARATSQR